MDVKPKKYTVRFEPSGLKTEVPSGTILLEAARKAGVYLSSICGGDGYCGKCKAIIDQGQFQSRPTTLLTPDETRENIVLACQTKVLSDITITVPKFHTLQASQILMDSDAHRFSELAGEVRAGVFEFDPLVRKLAVEMSEPTVHDHTADHERLYVAIREQIDAPIMQTGFRILQGLSKVLRITNYQVAVTIGRRSGTTEVIEVEPIKRWKTNYAVAVDLGTTTVVAHLLDLTNAKTMDTEATYNSQINFGEDYIRRIIYAEENNAFDEMQNRIVHDVNNLIVTLAARQKVDLHEITAVICAGNTAMVHFLLNLDPTRIRREPYVASAGFVPPIRAAEAGIQINKRGLLYCLPSVAAYVGSDIVAGVLTTRIYTKKEVSLFVDIGTNGEVVLGNRDWLVCASSSAGPAFEGSGVKHGMRAGAGAIEKLNIAPDGSIEFKTIGNTHPAGICGSGLLDTIAELFINGIIDRTGRFKTNGDARLTEGDEGLQFQLVPAANDHQEIVINQADIDNLVRSKAGVFAAIRVLMNSTQTKTEDIDAIYIAGGFGNFMNVQQAVTVGMLPDVPVDKIQFVGNTSIAGAKTVLLSRKALETAEKIAKSMTYFDLMSHPGYMDEFTRANFLPHTDLSLFPSVNSVECET
ncbi:MAG TPA: ASKHA domain-containing protein [Sedimentisphaerales bacterium]|nr:ASKHA domain-containing protein [Sedimentisphaerales bacterium]